MGMQVKQKTDGVVINQDHYIETMELPDHICSESCDTEKNKDDGGLMCEEGQSDFRGVVGKIGWLADDSRPDVVFDHITPSAKVGQASIEDMKKLRGETTEINFPVLGGVENLKIEGWGDAGYKSLPGTCQLW